MHRGNVDVGEKSPFFEAVLLEHAGTTVKDRVLSFMKSLMAAHTFMKASKYASSTSIEGDTNNTEHKPQLLSKTVAKPSSCMKREIEHTLTDLRLMTKFDIEAIVKNPVTKCINTFQSQIFKAVGSRFEDALQAIYLGQMAPSNLPCSTRLNTCSVK